MNNTSILTPELIVVGAAARLSTAVSGLAEVAATSARTVSDSSVTISAVSVGPGAEARSRQQRQAATSVVLHSLLRYTLAVRHR